MTNRSYLLEKAHEVEILANESWLYDDDLQYNNIPENGRKRPVCTLSSMATGSKTESAPGDDDPDPEVELMY